MYTIMFIFFYRLSLSYIQTFFTILYQRIFRSYRYTRLNYRIILFMLLAIFMRTVAYCFVKTIPKELVEIHIVNVVLVEA